MANSFVKVVKFAENIMNITKILRILWTAQKSGDYTILRVFKKGKSNDKSRSKKG